MLFRIILVLVWCGFASPTMAQVWPNKPAAFGTILDCQFNVKPTPSRDPAGCGIENSYNAGAIVTDSTAPVSPNNVYKSWISPGQSSGGTQLNYTLPQGNREMFMGIMWRTNPEFQGRPNSNKLFFLRGPQANGVWIFGNSALVNGSAPLIFGHNTGGGLLDNSHACSADLGLLCFPNVGPGLLTRGVWTKIEAYVKSSTTNTSRDGIVRWWINGVLVGNYTNLNYGGTAGINEWVWSETWDGGVSPVPTVDWSHFIDHLHISIPNCPGTCGGGGTPPPPPDTTPPGQVTSVTVTQLN